MYFSVTSENCCTSPVFSSVFAARMDLMNPPNSAPRTSRGTSPPRSDSTAMPSRPMRLAAIAPSTRWRSPASTSLNTAHLFPRDLGQPVFELDDRFAPVERGQLLGHGVIVGIAGEDVLVDVARVVGEALPRVQIGHGDRAGDVVRHANWRRFGRREDVRLVLGDRRRGLFFVF